ncbi:histidinol-phosphatase [Acetobacter cibinongensis]|uniref:Histidinol-phosphatase n=1 Tax=Acetobacter cibinongensis TaxID=146475 RepID=A0A0D6N5E9_9PROT|nr:inositol monophosphatase family protein [Acetobacter cibinongensis]GAN61204.1 inositol-1-monophosphatase/3'(2'),5'-bisphosphate nucleotidase [Acetobacter cibinongensis]GEL57902.1 histidinol-phosphatase [Acetobacter cibinongensis]
MNQEDLNLCLSVATMMADAARCVIRPWFRAPLAVVDKEDQSPVTLADRTAERVMRAILAERLPEHGIFGEEFGIQNEQSRYRWLLDPVDGTRAFVTGRPTFGTLIALLEDGVPVLGIIDQAVTQERWVGVAGRLTSLTSPLSGEAKTRACPALAQAELSCTSPEMLEMAPHDGWKALKKHTKRMTWGGDCYAYGLLAAGQIDIIAECDMNPWDWAALVPIIEGAGGRITAWDGSPLRADGDRTVLAVGDAALHAEAVATLQSGKAQAL